MRPVPQEVVSPHARSEKKSHRRLISFRGVAAWAREDEVVAPIECRLALSRRDMIEGHHRRREADAAVRADWSVLVQHPHSRFQIRGPARRVRRQRGGSSGGPGASAAARRARARRGRGSDVVISTRTGRAGRRGRLSSGPI